MSNYKQSSVEMMWNEIDNLFPFKDSVEAQNFCAILDKYKAMHKEEIINAHTIGYVIGGGNGYIHEPEQYYNEHYGK